jgi:hypothetical protein
MVSSVLGEPLQDIEELVTSVMGPSYEGRRMQLWFPWETPLTTVIRDLAYNLAESVDTHRAPGRWYAQTRIRRQRKGQRQ